MIETEERDDVNPVCPHCSQELDTVCFREVRAFIGRCYIYFCPHCRKTLGVTHRKGLLTR